MSRNPFLFHRLFLTLIFIITLLFAGFVSPASAGDISQFAVVNLVNQSRVSNGISPLAVSSELNQAAQAKAQAMFEQGAFDHYLPNGQSPWDYVLDQNYDYAFAGENLAMGWQTATAQHNAWMNSPTHRANILNSRFRDIGAAVVEDEMLGRQTTLVVQMFGIKRVSVQQQFSNLTGYIAQLLGI